MLLLSLLLLACPDTAAPADDLDETCTAGDEVRASCKAAGDSGGYACTEFVGSTWDDGFLADYQSSCESGGGTWSTDLCDNHGSDLGGCFVACQVQWYTSDTLDAATVQTSCETGGGEYITGD